MSRAARLAAALAVLGLGCPREQPPAPDERTLAGLRAEQDRLARGGAPAGPPKAAEDPLAQEAANPRPPITLPARPSRGTLGPVEFWITSVQVSQTVKGARLELTTNERFVRLALAARAQAPAQVAIATAQLRSGETTVPIARDVQRVGAGTPLAPLELAAGADREVVLYFELPEQLIGPGLTLLLTGPDARLELQVQ